MARFISAASSPFVSVLECSWAGEEAQAETLTADACHHRTAIRRVWEAIAEDPDRPLDIAALSMLAEMSPVQLERMFYRCCGISMQQWARHLQQGQGRKHGHPRGATRAWVIAAI